MCAFRPDELAEKYAQLGPDQQRQVSDLTARLAAEWDQGSVSFQGPGGSHTHRATGRLGFQFPDPEQRALPLHHVVVDLWDRDFGPDDCLGRGMTDRDGRFEIWYDPADAGWKDAPDLELRVYDAEHRFGPDGKLILHSKLIDSIHGDDDVRIEHYDFGECHVPFWEYDPAAPVPRLLVVEQGSPPQSYSAGRALIMVKQLAEVELAKRKHLLIHRLDSHKPTPPQIQADYPEPLSMRVERERPGHSRSDEYFGERILNGMSASVLDRDPANPARLWLHHHWNSYAQDGVHALPNVDIWFELREGRLMPVEIALQFRQRGHTEANPPLDPPLRFTPADGDRWLQAKRVARVSAALSAEIDAHFVQTHLNTEQYALAVYRNLRRSPLRVLLAPHVRDVVLINRDADSWLLGERGYLARATALTAESLNVRCRQVLGTLDWKNWRPRPILSEHHQFARAAHLFWQVLGEYVDWYFDQHHVAIVQHWHEVHRLSQDLVSHSVPFFLCGFLRSQRDESSDPSHPVGLWFEDSERMDLSVPRVRVGGEEKAIQPVTESDVADPQGLANAQQMCRYVIFHATFMHTWSNSRQYDDAGEVLDNGIGMRDGERGVFAPETDYSVALPPDQSTEQLWFAWMLSRAAYGHIMKNEDRDIHPELIRRLREKKEAFAEIGIDIRTIQSRTNI